MPLGRFILAIWKAISRTACLLPSFWWNCPSISWVTRWKVWQGSQLLGPFPWSIGHNPLTWTILGICQRMETWRHVQSCTEHLKQRPMQVTFQLLVVYLLVTLRERHGELYLQWSLVHRPLSPYDVPYDVSLWCSEVTVILFVSWVLCHSPCFQTPFLPASYMAYFSARPLTWVSHNSYPVGCDNNCL